jgi:hypothetical protein
MGASGKSVATVAISTVFIPCMVILPYDIITTVNDITKKCFGVNDVIDVNLFKTVSVPASGGKAADELANKFIKFQVFYREKLHTISDTHLASFAQDCHLAVANLCDYLKNASNGQRSHVNLPLGSILAINLNASQKTV